MDIFLVMISSSSSYAAVPGKEFFPLYPSFVAEVLCFLANLPFEAED